MIVTIAKPAERSREEERDRRNVPARDLSDKEIAAIRATKVVTDAPYELDDLDEDGEFIGKRTR